MARYRDDNNSIWGVISGFIILYVFWLIVLYLSNRTAFWRQFWYFIVFFVVIVIGIFAWKEFQYRRKEKKLHDLFHALKQNALEGYVKNFIVRFGMQKGKKNDWRYRGYSFDWERLKDLRIVLNEKGMRLSYDTWDDVLLVLRSYIQQNEENVTRESIRFVPKKFTDISGVDFEDLLYRLFGAMGYIVQKTGKVGDQGGDLIANKEGQRILIQAKRYAGAVGNAAIQEAVAAKKFYDCNRGMVVTNSSFTREAIELAKVNDVQLMGGGQLSELLLQYLSESWVNN